MSDDPRAHTLGFDVQSSSPGRNDEQRSRNEASLMGDLEDLVRRNPLASVAAALLAGIVAGKILLDD